MLSRTLNKSRSREIYRLQADLLKSLADPNRLMLLAELGDGEKSVGELARNLELRHSYASQLLSILRNAGVIKARRDGNMVYYRLASEKMTTACDIVSEVIVEQLQTQRDMLDAP
jgi:DNA-binding transcriptional ArsR family regulator